ncbi:regulatory LuxR family protein [Geodermatophilus normandii]|uniref:Regulatory LuxR family protein n=1 Tax=Geodermatophilus normandii TaxID=1137989 RepID=A0A317QNL8_9ACTN|nr:helix-turn-helix transcriptional regulator [Geodermatophilus normandii]PWW23200.1 regulatory LuxR family protein [Geodermatophilus normandii]
MGTGHLHARDADDLLELLRAARSEDPGPVLPWGLLEGLVRLVPCGVVLTCRLLDHRDCRTVVVQGALADGTRGVEHADARALEGPYARLRSPVTGGSRGVRALRRALASPFPRPVDGGGPARAEVVTDVPGELVVPLRSPAGPAAHLLLLRTDDEPFPDRDPSLLELARPHLVEVWAAAERRRAGIPRLTAREWEVLALAAAGLVTDEIAAALCIAVGTARKHAEHIREKCGAHSLAEAAARCLPAGSGPLPPGARDGLGPPGR